MLPVEVLDWPKLASRSLRGPLNNDKARSTLLFMEIKHCGSRCVPSFSGSGYEQLAPNPRFRHDYEKRIAQVIY